MYRFLALSAALLLSFFVSTTDNFSHKTDKGVTYAAYADDYTYTNHRLDDEKFLPQKEVVIARLSADYSYVQEKASSSARVPEALNIRGPPALLTSV